MTMPQLPAEGSTWRTPLIVIAAGCLIAVMGFGVRSSMGLFLEPMTAMRGWDRETFSLAMAIQNLLWGLGVPVAGIFADRIGPARVIIFGAAMYAAGIWGMSAAEGAMALHLFGGVLTGLGIAFTAFTLAMAAMARVVGPERRSLVLGLGTAAGSLGQVIFTPLGRYWIDIYGWEFALILLTATLVILVPLALVLPSGGQGKGEVESNQTIREAFREAMAHRGFVLLTLGFFVCGYQIGFITIHFPAFVKGVGLSDSVGATALALVGLFNIAGSLLSGVVGQRFSKKAALSLIYFLRSALIVALMMAPKTELTIYIFAGSMGLLWLSTVPLTTGIIAQVFGMRYMATLFGIVFLSHQLGSSLGIWLGGRLYDTTGSYDVVWWTGAALGVAAGILHLPINERPLARLQPQPAT